MNKAKAAKGQGGAAWTVLAVLMAAGVIMANDAAAASHERSVNQRQSFQRERVATGVRQGDLTRREAGRLNAESRQIARKEQAFRSDGHFSHSERREIHQGLNRHSRHINQQRHDGDRRHYGQSQGRHAGYAYGGGYGGGHAYGRRDGIDRMQYQQGRQIQQGIRNGSITQHEARRLYAEQRQIAALERRYRADGVLTGAERRDLYGKMREASRHIYNQSHDAQRRY
jgi:uncharacterized membrane protein YebE (DUF533 family)